MKTLAAIAALGVLALASVANGWEFRVRFVERAGNVDIPLLGNTIDTTDGAQRTIRVQFGVFDHGGNPAPLGGFIGWNDGYVLATPNTPGGVGSATSLQRAMFSRLAPFNFAPASGGANGLPAGGPGTSFTQLHDIDATIGIQSFIWNCDGLGNALPEPQPIIRGRNQYVSVFAFVINPDPGATQYTITVGGTLNAAGDSANSSGWVAVQSFPPDCKNPADPGDDSPGIVTYSPYPVQSLSFLTPKSDSMLNVIVNPPEGSTSLMLVPDSTCYNASANTMTVTVQKTEGAVPAVGGQFLLAYDTSVLEYIGGVAGTGDPADTFDLVLIPPGAQEPVHGEVNFAVSASDGAGTTNAGVMATLTFRVGGGLDDICDMPVLICFRPDEAPLHTVVTDNDGLLILGSTFPLPSVTIDTTPPAPPVVTPDAGSSFGKVYADAGQCSATQAWTGSTSDACDPAAPIVYSIGMSPISSPYTFPPGPTTVTATATDGCGNTSMSTFDVNVLQINQVVVSVRLANVSDGTYSRCITFDITDSGAGCPTNAVSETLAFTDGLAEFGFDVPCGVYNCMTARDPLHTLRGTVGISVVGRRYIADFTGDDALVGGNLNDDEVIDILDFGGLVGQFGVSYGSPDTSCSTFPIHADFSGNGSAFSEDFTFISTNFLELRDEDCCGNESRQPPRRMISTTELVQNGWDHMLVADLNGDGWVDEGDIAAFVQGARPCESDINRDAEVNSTDFFTGVISFFAGEFDFNRNGATDSTDFFSFLTAFLAGC